ncbi:hypothetical protein DPMN_054183 [Dreissena polymorpha]|uniref:Uncharacterized protein n=1 Tax=Dreissena polymorpha TaxID=45954 RepID=A0A9D4HRD2_DREPO|nr:hypothetical protein DPMN_054183 [Dreissena polymorpha]
MFKTFTNPEDLEPELKKLGISDTIAQTRITQLQEYRQLQSCVNGAKVLLKIQHQYNLTGDFEPVKEIAEV